MALMSPQWRMRLLKWHRWLTLALLVQLTIWLTTALIMTLIARSSTTAYKFDTASSFNAVSSWPELDDLQTVDGDEIHNIVLEQRGVRPVLSLGDQALLELPSLEPATRLSEAAIAAYASKLSGENIGPDQVTLKTRNSPEYQKLPVPAWRVEADKAVLFFDPVSGEYLSQTTGFKFLENLMKSIHVMDYSGRAEFKKNILLTFFALLFFSVALLGVLAVKRVFIKRKAIPTRMKVHQILGLVLGLQVFFWVTSGLSVAWLLAPFGESAEENLAPHAVAIDWDNVRVHPRDIYVVDDNMSGPVAITLTSLLGEPVYKAVWSGRNPKQALWSARDGREITLTQNHRDRIAKAVLIPEASSSLVKWEEASDYKDLDFYFYTGPYPVWKGYFTQPEYGAISIDQVTGHVHVPRTRKEIILERYYNVHVSNWRFGVIKYRREPVLLIVIGLAFGLLVSGILVHYRRWKLTGKI